jgi:hypothetical protein
MGRTGRAPSRYHPLPTSGAAGRGRDGVNCPCYLCKLHYFYGCVIVADPNGKCWGGQSDIALEKGST